MIVHRFKVQGSGFTSYTADGAILNHSKSLNMLKIIMLWLY